MNLRLLLPATAVALISGAESLPQRGSAEPVPLAAIADSFVSLNRPPSTGRAWADLSDSTRMRSARRLDRIAAQLNGPRAATDTGAMNEMLRENLVEVVHSSIGARVCRFHLWSAPNQFSGWHVAASNWARTVRVGDDSSRARALRALNDLPEAMHDERIMLQRGLDSGYTSSAPVMNVVAKPVTISRIIR